MLSLNFKFDIHSTVQVRKTAIHSFAANKKKMVALNNEDKDVGCV